MPEIVVAAESRTETGKNVNRRLRSRGADPRRPLRRQEGRDLGGRVAEGDRVDPEERLRREHAVRPRPRRHAPQGHPQGVPARAASRAASCTPTSTRSPSTRRSQVKVHVELTGVPVGVKVQGGIVDFVTRELEIECLPTDIPEKIVVDISAPRARQAPARLRPQDLGQGQGPDRARRRDRPRRGAASRGSCAGGRGGGGRGCGRAEPEVIKKGKTEEGEAAEEKPEKGEKPEKKEREKK